MNLPKFPQTSKTERIGVMHVATILTEMGLIFRETSNSDTGIDGYIEEVNNNQEATGRLLAAQIKLVHHIYRSMMNTSCFMLMNLI